MKIRGVREDSGDTFTAPQKLKAWLFSIMLKTEGSKWDTQERELCKKKKKIYLKWI